MIKAISALLAGMTFLGSAIQAEAAPVYFQGGGTVESVTPACAGSVAVGDFYRFIYRLKVGLLDPVDGLSVLGDRSTFNVASANALSGSLSGTTLTVNTLIDSNALVFTLIPGSTNLGIASIGGLPTASAINLKVIGTINGFFLIPGCNVTVRALLVARPT